MSTRHLEPGAASQVREARRETAERHAVVMSGVTLDDLCAADVQQSRDFVEVFAVVMHRDFHPTVFALAALAEVLASYAVDQRLTIDGAGAELDQ